MKRGEVWLVSGGGDHTGKPWPAVILQDDAFDTSSSVTLCPLTSHGAKAPLVRIPISPLPLNGLQKISWLMADKITTVSRTKLSQKIGEIASDELLQLNQAIIVFLGLTNSTRPATAAKTRKP